MPKVKDKGQKPDVPFALPVVLPDFPPGEVGRLQLEAWVYHRMDHVKKLTAKDKATYTKGRKRLNVRNSYKSKMNDKEQGEAIRKASCEKTQVSCGSILYKYR